MSEETPEKGDVGKVEEDRVFVLLDQLEQIVDRLAKKLGMDKVQKGARTK